MKKASLLFVFIIAATCCFSQKPTHTFALGDSAFMLDGKPLQLISGEIHNTRVPRQYWRDRMRMAKAMGLNTIGTYVFWNAQEPEPGRFEFTGQNDIAEFVRAAKAEGLWVVLRPSPYVCAEWEFGGYPYWLLKDQSLKVRSQDPNYVKAYREYILALGKQLSPLLVTHGGNILMVQIENEYGSYSDDKAYLDLNRKIFREAGFDGVLFTCDGPSQMPKGYLPGYLPAVNGEDNPAKVKTLINKYHDGKGPYYIAEWYPGWFDSWGQKHAGSNAEQDAKKLDEVLSAGISINQYMFHGGTTRGFMNGANMNRREPYAPQTSSYDYDAPLDEAGNPTAKYYKFREVIEKHLPAGQHLPPVPAKHIAKALPPIKLTGVAPMFENLPKPVIAEHPLSFEELNQAYGFVLYRTKLKEAANGLLKLNGMRDYATVYVNGKRVAVLDRRLKQDSLQLEAPAGATLDVLVENNGRINYGPYLIDNRQGLTGKVMLSDNELLGWEMYKLPFDDMSWVKNTMPAGITFVKGWHSVIYPPDYFKSHPALYAGNFTVTKPADTYLDMHGFGKGFVFLNGHNLGKYWYIGPQQTIYVPAVWLNKGVNHIQVFDQLQGDHKSINTLDHAVLNEVVK